MRPSRIRILEKKIFTDLHIFLKDKTEPLLPLLCTQTLSFNVKRKSLHDYKYKAIPNWALALPFFTGIRVEKKEAEIEFD